MPRKRRTKRWSYTTRASVAGTGYGRSNSHETGSSTSDGGPEAERAELKERLRGVGFHAELQGGVRAPGFRALTLKVQETVSSTSFDMLTRIYDAVTVGDMRDQGDAMGIPRTG